MRVSPLLSTGLPLVKPIKFTETMRLLYLDNHGIPCLSEFSGDKVPLYAILSHTWRLDGGEVTFKNISEGTATSKAGYTKISLCGGKAASHGLKYFWVDTCCT
jgi:hypothetical protein